MQSEREEKKKSFTIIERFALKCAYLLLNSKSLDSIIQNQFINGQLVISFLLFYFYCFHIEYSFPFYDFPQRMGLQNACLACLECRLLSYIAEIASACQEAWCERFLFSLTIYYFFFIFYFTFLKWQGWNVRKYIVE